jgi:hypothetical protein
MVFFFFFCQTPIPGQTCELTCQEQEEEQQEPQTNSNRRDSAKVLKFLHAILRYQKNKIAPLPKF